MHTYGHAACKKRDGALKHMRILPGAMVMLIPALVLRNPQRKQRIPWLSSGIHSQIECGIRSKKLRIPLLPKARYELVPKWHLVAGCMRWHAV